MTAVDQAGTAVPEPVPPPPDIIERLVSLCKQRGFVFPSSEIYGGINALYDYGPLGTRLRRNIRNAWWHRMIDLRDDIEAVETSIIMNPSVWVASGHVSNFTDPLVDCTGRCRKRWRADHVEAERTARGRDASQHLCPECDGALTEARQFNLMFKTFLGPVEEAAAQVYLRPETAQGMFVNFLNVHNATRRRLPFGIAQQGRSFRNEITPQNWIFRVREFEQMEMEFFCRPGTDEEWHRYWIAERHRWYVEVLGVSPDRLRIRPHDADELSHYSKATSDIEYEFPFGWGELEGIANRTDFDLRAHQEHSKEDLSYLDPESGERYLPYVIEPAAGVERIMATVLLDAYDEEEVRGEVRVVLRFHRNVAPVQVAVMPLSKKEELIAPAREVQDMLKERYRVEYDQTGGNIGRRYRRQDEIGTPFCVTVDFDTLEDRAVTIRERDSMEQERVPIDRLGDRLSELFATG
jgi:glycyl-tRNA synthetase